VVPSGFASIIASGVLFLNNISSRKLTINVVGYKNGNQKYWSVVEEVD
jgi:hypothetical protein